MYQLFMAILRDKVTTSQNKKCLYMQITESTGSLTSSILLTHEQLPQATQARVKGVLLWNCYNQENFVMLQL